jgi:hypothetical protein
VRPGPPATRAAEALAHGLRQARAQITAALLAMGYVQGGDFLMVG